MSLLVNYLFLSTLHTNLKSAQPSPSSPTLLPEGEGNVLLPSSPTLLPEGEGSVLLPSPPGRATEGEGRFMERSRNEI